MQLGKADSCEGVGSESQIAGICVRLFFFLFAERVSAFRVSASSERFRYCL